MDRSLTRPEALEPRDVPATTLTPNEAFVTQIYQDFLLRDPEPEGLAAHVRALDSGVRADRVALGIIDSDEGLSKFVGAQYDKYLGRAASSGEVNPWVTFLRTGGSFDNLRAAIISSDEAFTNAGGTNEAWLESAYPFALGRKITSSEQASNLAALAERGAAVERRFAVVLGLVQSVEGDRFTARHFYNDYLRRGPDPEGFPGWWMQLNSGVSDQEVTSQFLSSPEFFQSATSTRFRDIIAMIW